MLCELMNSNNMNNNQMLCKHLSPWILYTERLLQLVVNKAKSRETSKKALPGRDESYDEIRRIFHTHTFAHNFYLLLGHGTKAMTAKDDSTWSFPFIFVEQRNSPMWIMNKITSDLIAQSLLLFVLFLFLFKFKK